MNLSKRIEVAIDALSGSRARMHDYGKEDTVELLRDIQQELHIEKEPKKIKDIVPSLSNFGIICLVILIYMGVFRILHEYMKLSAMLATGICSTAITMYLYLTHIIKGYK